MKKIEKVIYSEAHRGIVEYPLLTKPDYALYLYNVNDVFYSADLEAYNKWLSEPPIAIVRDEDIEFFSVPREESEYETKEMWIDFNIVGVKQLVAIPKVEKDNYVAGDRERDLEPSQLQTSEPVASHSCTVGNSVQQSGKLTIGFEEFEGIECVMWFEEMKGMLVSGETKEDAFNKLITSLLVKIAFDNNIEFKIKPYHSKSEGGEITK